MRVVLITSGVVLALMAAFVVWRLWATYAGGSRSRAQLAARIEPVERRLASGETPDLDDLERFARDRLTRKVLYEALERHGHPDLFPAAYQTAEAMAEADLVAWLNHPNELGAVPDEIELMARLPVPGEDPGGGRYFLFRYRMHAPHWAARDGWLAGVAGPGPAEGPGVATAPGTFSRFEPYDSKSPEEHVAAVHRLVAGRR
jgi:hypothetical protein